MEVPKVVDSYTLQHLHDVLRKADMHKLREDLLTCLPSFPAFPDLHRFRDALKNSSPLTDLLISISNWHIVELVTNCLPESFSHINHTDVCVLVSSSFCYSEPLWIIEFIPEVSKNVPLVVSTYLAGSPEKAWMLNQFA